MPKEGRTYDVHKQRNFQCATILAFIFDTIVMLVKKFPDLSILRFLSNNFLMDSFTPMYAQLKYIPMVYSHVIPGYSLFNSYNNIKLT